MGLLKLLTFPLYVPAAGGHWVLRTLLDQAQRQFYDESAIRQQLAELEAQHQAGKVSDHDFDQQEEMLFERLLEAKAYQQRKQAEQPTVR